MTGMRQKRCAADHLARLEAVAEEAERGARRHPVGRVGQAVEAGGGGAGEHGLPDPLDQPLGQIVLAHGHEQHADARAAVGRLAAGELALDARLALAADDRGGEAGELERGLAHPAR